MEFRGICAGSPLTGSFDEFGTNQELDLYLLFCLHPLAQCLIPGDKMVHPSLDTVEVTSKLGHAKAPLPAVIAQGSHGDFRPDRIACPTIAQHSAQQVVTISKDVSLNHDLLADGALDGKTASIDGWLYPLNNHSSPPGVRVHTASSLCTL